MESVPATNSWPGIMVAEQPKHPPLNLGRTINLVDGGGPLFAKTPDTQTVWESHNDEVVELPKASELQLAASHAKFKLWRTKN